MPLFSAENKGSTLPARLGTSGKSGRCHCCPYGYHIDLDFVRYCQVLNQVNISTVHIYKCF